MSARQTFCSFIILSCLLLPALAMAQNQGALDRANQLNQMQVFQLYQQVMQLYQQGKYAQAIPLAKEVLTLSE